MFFYPEKLTWYASMVHGFRSSNLSSKDFGVLFGFSETVHIQFGLCSTSNVYHDVFHVFLDLWSAFSRGTSSGNGGCFFLTLPSLVFLPGTTSVHSF